MIALIADIHGNYTALKEVLKKIDEMDIQEIYCLGDITGYYTEINECCNELRDRNINSVIGNHDWYLISKSFCLRSNSVNDCLEYQKKIITKVNFDWLCTLPVFMNVGELSILHGGWTNPIDEYVNPTAEYFSRIKGRYFASGHTHRQVVEVFGGKIYCNPGSVGQPRDNNPQAAFATFDGTDFNLHRVSYDVERVGTLMEQAGFSGYYYGCLNTGAKQLQW